MSNLPPLPKEAYRPPEIPDEEKILFWMTQAKEAQYELWQFQMKCEEYAAIIDRSWRAIPANLPGVEGDMPIDEALKVAFKEAVRLEREAGAQICEARAMDAVPDDSAIDELYLAAAAIRARSQEGQG